MARRKARKPRKPPRQEKLDKEFQCPFCNYQESVKIYKKQKKGYWKAKCHVCLEKYRIPIDPLIEAIDVYHNWIDACEQINNE